MKKTYSAIRDPDRCPTHPGVALDDILDDVDMSKTKIATTIGISRAQLYSLLRGAKPLTPSIAVRIAKLVGGSAESWLKMQASFDAWNAERDFDVSKITTLEVA